MAFTASLLLMALLATEWLVRRYVEPNDNLPKHLRIFQEATQSIAAFGDSHVACGFRPLNGAINLGFPGENIENIAHKVALFGKRVKLSHVIVQADVHMFARYRLGEIQGYDALFESAENPLAEASHWIRALSGYHRPKLIAYWRVWFNRGTFENHLRLERNGWQECPDRWRSLEPAGRARMAAERVALHQPMERFPNVPFAARYAEMLRDLVRAGVQVCMVEFPVSAEYRERLAGKTADRVRSWFAQLAKATGSRFFAFGDYFHGEPSSFADADHLSPAAAALFTKRILDDCLTKH